MGEAAGTGNIWGLSPGLAFNQTSSATGVFRRQR